VVQLIFRRLLALPVILLAIYTVTLSLSWAIPGSPLEKGDRAVPPEVEQAMKAKYRLDSLPGFYVSYLSRATGVSYLADKVSGRAGKEDAAAIEAGRAPVERTIFDLGPSLQYEDWRVNEILAASLPVSVTIGGAAILIALCTGLTAGIVGAVKPGSLADIGTLIVALVGISLPSFVTGTILLMVFAVGLGWFSVATWGSIGDLVLPAITLSLPFAAYIARLTRMGMIEILGSDYIRTARAKGLPQRQIVLKHALKNAFLPVLSYLGPATALAMTGSFVVERIFTVPGLGQHFVNAVLNKDLFMIMGVVLTFSTLLVMFNLVVDVLYRWVDPRIV
jgi:oligopeptide transport system permease protein